jgi:PAS domain S-box-containing protein
MNAGADDYIVKPFGARELVARIKALLEITRARRESQERFRAMADSSPIMIWMTDAHGRTTFLNHTYLDYFGISAEQTGTFAWQEVVHPEDRDDYIAAFHTALQRYQTFHRRVRLRRFDGEWRWFESRGNPILDESGAMVGFIGSSPDITEIYESQQKLRELDQRKDEFLANMSHEIRSPLAGIMGYADLLLDKLTDPDDIECLKTVKESG